MDTQQATNTISGAQAHVNLKVASFKATRWHQEAGAISQQLSRALSIRASQNNRGIKEYIYVLYEVYSSIGPRNYLILV